MLEHAAKIASVPPSRSLVLFVASNTPESLEAYLGFLQKRIVPLMVDASIKQDAFCALLDQYQPEYVWAPESFAYEGTIVHSFGAYRLYRTEFSSELALYPELALLLTTSGSTGSKKYVRLSYENIKANALSIAQYLSIQQSDRAITTLPFSYSYGLSIINSHLISRASLVLTDKSLFDREFWTVMKESSATSFGGVPYTYAMLKRLRFERMDLPALRYITQAGGHLDEGLQEEFAEICLAKDIDFFVMYGQTEGTARLSYLPAQYASKKIGSIGIAIPGGSLYLIDDEGEKITKPNTPGELFYQGANVSLGYAEKREDLARADTRLGVLETGDLASFDEDGFFKIVGRKKRFLKVFGNRVNLDELEQLLHSAGYQAACAGFDDNVLIFIEQGDVSEIKAFVSSQVGLNKSAFDVRSIKKIPRNEAGKILYSELEALC